MKRSNFEKTLADSEKWLEYQSLSFSKYELLFYKMHFFAAWL
jgi:hypothetical protein